MDTTPASARLLPTIAADLRAARADRLRRILAAERSWIEWTGFRRPAVDLIDELLEAGLPYAYAEERADRVVMARLV